jgi:CRP-like cAMP-binding protein
MVGDGKTISKYQKDQIVFSQGHVADAVFYIQKGKIKLTVVSERGKEAVVGILEPSHFFGEGCLNGHPLRVTTATAIEQSLITCIPKAAMIATLHDEVGFSELFMADLLNRNSRIEEDLIDQLFNSSEKRLARALLLLANFGKEGTIEPIIGNEVAAQVPSAGTIILQIEARSARVRSAPGSVVVLARAAHIPLIEKERPWKFLQFCGASRGLVSSKE